MKKFLLSAVLFATATGALFTKTNTAHAWYCGGTYPGYVGSQQSQVCAITNQYRARYGRGPVVMDARLSSIAQAYAQRMAIRHFFNHFDPWGGGPGDRLRQGGVRTTGWGENIAVGQRNATEVMNSWIGSEGHRANILQGYFHKIGIGVYNNYWVQEFSND